jgi:uridine phosphorylase
LVAAASARGATWHAGVTWSLDAFYARNAVLAPDGSLASMHARGFWTSAHEAAIRDMQAAGVLNCEMEAGALLTLASLFGLRAGCLCVVSDRTQPVRLRLSTAETGLVRFVGEIGDSLAGDHCTSSTGTGMRFQVKAEPAGLRVWITSLWKRPSCQT